MNVLIPEAMRPDTMVNEQVPPRARISPQPRRGRVVAQLLGLAPVVVGLGGALWVAIGRQV